MAAPLTIAFGETGDQLIDAATNGYVWQLGADRTIRWSLSDGFAGETWFNRTHVHDIMQTIFGTYAYYANVKFSYAGYFSTPLAAGSISDINLTLDATNSLFNSSSQWARAFFSDARYDQAYTGAPGDVYLNANGGGNFLSSYAIGSQGYFLFLHEIGHSLGLKHPHDDGGTGRPTLESLGLEILDEDWFSVMSYNDDASWNNFAWDPATPMLMDALAMQYLYGPNTSTNAGNDTYTLPLNNFYITVWDAAGNDTVELANSSVGWTVYLPEWQLSTLVSTKAGFAAPTSELGSTLKNFYWLTGDMENLGGSLFADVLTGNSLSNMMRGFGGNDSIDGGAGLDSAVYSGTRSNYTITKAGAAFTVTDNTGTNGIDTVSNIERLRFNDVSVALDIGGNAGKAYRLYQAAFDRMPDLEGLGVWINQLDIGQSLEWVSAQFQASEEFKLRYGTNVSTDQFVTLLYKNVLHREPDSGGLIAWKGALDAGAQSRAQVLAGFSESVENQITLIGVIQNGIEYTPWVE